MLAYVFAKLLFEFLESDVYFVLNREEKTCHLIEELIIQNPHKLDEGNLDILD
jgi:hypothetical protein